MSLVEGQCNNHGTGCRCILTYGHLGPHHYRVALKHETEPPLASRDPEVGVPANWFSVDYETVRAIAETHYEGDTHYGQDNWRKGLKASDLLNHAMEHLFKMLNHDTSERHLEHALWNLGKLRWVAKNKPELIDVPSIRAYFGLPPME